ncbi:MAG: hypothetical protein P9X24_00835, partial [Candidatus Hatepunaea meridiana]|nr:hypothetical protein [Candidatus Hatepunaea meridiana]
MKERENVTNPIVIALFVLILIIFFGVSSDCLAEDNLPGWPEVVNGAWQWGGQWYGPLIADIDPINENGKEIIVADQRSIQVYACDSDPFYENLEVFNIPENLWNAGYRMRGIPAVGDVTGDGYNDIVFLCSDDIILADTYIAHGGHTHTVRNLGWLYKVFVFNGENEVLYTSDAFISVYAKTPVLADIDVLDYNPLYPSFEDRRMEIIIGGKGQYGYALNHDECFLNYNTRTWHLAIIQLNQDSTFTKVDYDEDTIIGSLSGHDDYLLPAIGDMNHDGMKEIVMSHRWGIGCWTYDPSQDNNEKLSFNWMDGDDEDWIRPDPWPAMGPVNGEGFYTIGPIMADIENDGNLWAIIPHFNGTDEEDYNTKLFVVDINRNEHDDFEESVYLGSICSDESSPLETFAVTDILNNGHPDIIFHTVFENDGKIYWQDEDNNSRQTWPQEIEDLQIGVCPAVSNLTFDNNDADVWIAHNLDEENNNFFGFSRDDENDPSVEEEFNGISDFSTPVIADINADGTLEMAVRSFHEGNMVIQIWDLDDAEIPDGENESSLIEWSQLKNGPRHDGLYAQTYSGTLPEGSIYWRDRVIVADEVIVERGTCLNLMTRSPLVVEFNDGDLIMQTFLTQELYGYLLVFKPNFEGADGGLIWQDPDEQINFENVSFVNITNSIEDGSGFTFENCTFSGESGIGDHIAIDAEDATVNLINCTFKGYDTAVMLDN